MGNYITTATCLPSDTAGKVILWDGSVQEFSCPLEAAELMLEHPQQVVVEFNATINQKRPIPLPADHKLDVKKIYVMLPVRRGKPITLSSEEARRVLSNGTGHKFPLQKKESADERPDGVRSSMELFPESSESRPEYLNMQYSGKGWKPSLDTINEKVRHRLF
ncbi:hypothetical protein F3Y22_tig00111100pilonHSYRG00158 [Hibiscus syriacus]|uniref:Uncharacterized protein n=1 Tax=Hibiscus syriacus TaxID=106335 RepID=A0A6A2YZW9_HIBSY|nr:hypothetical protein F3Y22_tig00111100pilonHSYRG00158 [Hibiscus syriacus]